jgi:DNA topoisomerase I
MVARADPDLCAPEAAADAGLRYVSDEGPGIRRRRRGKGFSYERPDGRVITSKAERERIAAIAIPPAWTDVWISPVANGHILATGRDARGRKQYRYHPEWRRIRDSDKFDRLADFGAALPDLRAEVESDLAKRGMPEVKALALVTSLLDQTLIRVGNENYVEENGSYGLTTLRPGHVTVEPDRVVFDFTSKGGLDRALVLEDRALARAVHQCHELGGQTLFSYQTQTGEVLDVTSTDVNGYLREKVGDEITAKDFRTWGGTTAAAATLAVGRPAESAAHADKAVLAAYDVAAEVLGNTRAVCRSAYVHPAVPEAFRSGQLHEHWKRARSAPRFDRAEHLVLRLLRD